MAYLNSDLVMPQSPDSDLEEILNEILKRECPKEVTEARAISTTMLEDKETLDMIGAHYSMHTSFDRKENPSILDGGTPVLEPEKLVELIKRRNSKYDKMTTKIYTAMYYLSSHYAYRKEYPNSCPGTKWSAVRDAVFKRNQFWDSSSEDENEAISIYKRMQAEAGLEWQYHADFLAKLPY